MGAFLDKPKTEKLTDKGTGNGLRYGLSSMQGWRVEMEDAHSAIIGIRHLKDWSFFAVFDGHAGAKVSSFCSEQLVESITMNEYFRGNNSDVTNNPPTEEQVAKAIKTGFLSLDEKIRVMPQIISGEDKSGSTAVCVMLSPKHMFFANCGDSRALLCRDGRVQYSTQDHKPVNPEEKERIQNAGGSVMIQRVNGSLAVSRALGDFEYKNVKGKGPCEQLVSPEPEIFVEDRSPMDEFIVLACDGIWDVMTNEEVCDFVRDRMQISDDLEHICNLVIDTCLHKGSRDNMSMVIIAFEGAPKVSEAALNNERELDKRLEKRIKALTEESEPTDVMHVQYIMHMLTMDDIEGLPPGGGLFAKRSTVEQIFKRFHPHPPQEISIRKHLGWDLQSFLALYMMLLVNPPQSV